MRSVVGLILSLIVTGPAIAASNDAPPKWMENCMLRMKKAGFAAGYPEFIGTGYRSPTRYEFAVTVYATEEQLEGVLTTLTKGLPSVPNTNDHSHDAELIEAIGWLPYCSDLMKVAKELKPELTKLGADAPGLLRRIGSSATLIRQLSERLDSFPDVSKEHWAFSAVESLREAGILHGYPDGAFKGG